MDQLEDFESQLMVAGSGAVWWGDGWGGEWMGGY